MSNFQRAIRLQKIKAKATVMTDEEQAHICKNDDLLLSTNKETLVCMLLSAFLRIDADREKIAALEKTWRCFNCGFETADEGIAQAHFGEGEGEFAICVEWAQMSPEDRLADYQSAIRELNMERDSSFAQSEMNTQLREKIAALEAERENRKKSIPDLPSGIEQARYIVAHADEFIDLAVHLATWALELHAQVGELHGGLGRTEANEAVILRAENAKMRKALEQISLGAHARFWDVLRGIAREALK